MIVAHLIVDGEEKEQREVPDEWLHMAAAAHWPVLINGVRYTMLKVEHCVIGGAPHALVDLCPS